MLSTASAEMYTTAICYFLPSSTLFCHDRQTRASTLQWRLRMIMLGMVAGTFSRSVVNLVNLQHRKMMDRLKQDHSQSVKSKFCRPTTSSRGKQRAIKQLMGGESSSNCWAQHVNVIDKLEAIIFGYKGRADYPSWLPQTSAPRSQPSANSIHSSDVQNWLWALDKVNTLRLHNSSLNWRL